MDSLLLRTTTTISSPSRPLIIPSFHRPIAIPWSSLPRRPSGRTVWQTSVSAPRCSIPQISSSSDDEEPEETDGGKEEDVVEELETLEEAAMAGDKEAREPSDYEWRAQVFYESSRVFQELKEQHDGEREKNSS